MRLSHNSLLTIFLVWGGVCLSRVYCAPITYDDATSGSDVQLAKLKHPVEILPLEAGLAGTPTSISEKPTEIDIHLLASPSVATGGRYTPPNDENDDSMFKYWFAMYLEFLNWLWSFIQSLGSAAESLITFLIQQVLPLALFLAACAGTVFLGFALVAGVMQCVASVVSHSRGPTERTRLLHVYVN